MLKKIIYFFLLISILFSCGNFTKKVVNIKYREKNAVETIKIDSVNGNITVVGWSKDSIEIGTKKILFSGFKTDLSLMDTLFNQIHKQLNIKTKIPARIDGRIDLLIYVPYIQTKIFIDSQKGNIKISKVLSDIEITNKNGNIDAVFQGNILRINSYKTKIKANITSYNSCDIVINNEEGATNVNVNTIGKSSYLDIKSLDGDIHLNISKEIDHQIMATNKYKKIFLKYKLLDESFTSGDYTYISGKRGKNYKNFTVDVSNNKGKIFLSLFQGQKNPL